MKCANCGNEFKGVYCPLCGTVDASYLNAAQAEEKDPLYDFAVERDKLLLHLYNGVAMYVIFGQRVLLILWKQKGL